MKRILWILLGALFTLTPMACSSDDDEKVDSASEVLAKLPINTMLYNGKQVAIQTTISEDSESGLISVYGDPKDGHQSYVRFDLRIPSSRKGKAIHLNDIKGLSFFNLSFGGHDNGHFQVEVFKSERETMSLIMKGEKEDRYNDLSALTAGYFEVKEENGEMMMKMHFTLRTGEVFAAHCRSDVAQ